MKKFTCFFNGIKGIYCPQKPFNPDLMNMASVKDDKVVNAFLPHETCTLLLQIRERLWLLPELL